MSGLIALEPTDNSRTARRANTGCGACSAGGGVKGVGRLSSLLARAAATVRQRAAQPVRQIRLRGGEAGPDARPPECPVAPAEAVEQAAGNTARRTQPT